MVEGIIAGIVVLVLPPIAKFFLYHRKREIGVMKVWDKNTSKYQVYMLQPWHKRLKENLRRFVLTNY